MKIAILVTYSSLTSLNHWTRTGKTFAFHSYTYQIITPIGGLIFLYIENLKYLQYLWLCSQFCNWCIYCFFLVWGRTYYLLVTRQLIHFTVVLMQRWQAILVQKKNCMHIDHHLFRAFIPSKPMLYLSHLYPLWKG